MLAAEPKYIVLNPKDNVAVALDLIKPNEKLNSLGIAARQEIPPGHKIATCSINTGEKIIKYGR